MTKLPGSDGSESLLSRGVPDLQLYGLSVQLDGSDLEVDADGGDVRLGVGVVGEAEQQARLAHAGVADQQKLEQVIAAMKRNKNKIFITVQKRPFWVELHPLLCTNCT